MNEYFETTEKKQQNNKINGKPLLFLYISINKVHWGERGWWTYFAPKRYSVVSVIVLSPHFVYDLIVLTMYTWHKNVCLSFIHLSLWIGFGLLNRMVCSTWNWIYWSDVHDTYVLQPNIFWADNFSQTQKPNHFQPSEIPKWHAFALYESNITIAISSKIEK